MKASKICVVGIVGFLCSAGALAQSVCESRLIDDHKVLALKNLVREGARIFMRHGAQEKNDHVRKEKDPARQKIEMMRLPSNRDDGITPVSRIEAEAFAHQLGQILTADQQVRLRTSKNERAFQPAAILGRVLKVRPEISEALGCINYLSEDKLSANEILKIAPDGRVAFSGQTIDKVSGPGTYDSLDKGMVELFSEKSDRLAIYVTHTQQLQWVIKHLKLPPRTLGELGFVVIPNSPGAQPLVFENGIFKDP